MHHSPTDEQRHAITQFKTGEPLKISRVCGDRQDFDAPVPC